MDDMTNLSRAELEAEVARLRDGIRAHRNAEKHDRCWLDDAALYRLLPEGPRPIVLPPCGEFLAGCARFWLRRQAPDAQQHDPLCPAVYVTGELRPDRCTCGATGP